MNFEWTIKIGDILTSVTILVSVVALLVSWAKDQALRQKVQADKVRRAAATTLVKLERWQVISLSFYQKLQVVFVETSERFAKEPNVESTRDYLWKNIWATHAAILSHRLDEDIENAYVDLYGYHPAIRQLFLSTMDKLNAVEEDVFLAFLEATQKDVREFESRKRKYTTASMGNALRKSARRCHCQQQEQIQKILKPTTKFLANLVAMSDSSILKHRVFDPPPCVRVDVASNEN